MKLAELFEHARAPDTNREFGFHNAGNVIKTKVALSDAGIKFNITKGGGITYFMFDSAASTKKAMAVVKKVIDKSKESEWDSISEASVEIDEDLKHEHKEDKFPHFGYTNASNARKVKTALKSANFNFDYAYESGIHYFYFATEADGKRALKVAEKIIDTSKEE